MSIMVFMAVIFAALLHATWNAVAKSQSDKLLTMTALVFGSSLWGMVALPFAQLPNKASFVYLAVGILLHIGYQIVLQSAYKLGDLSLVYPISRGTAPLIVTIFSIFVWNIDFEFTTILGLAAIIFAVFCMAFTKNNSGGHDGKAILFALVTACFIAAYSLVDGTGARLSGDSLGFYACLTIANGFGFAAFIGFVKPENLALVFKTQKYIMVFGGLASFGAFAIAMWAFTQAPIALVTALRESSIMFAMLIGVVFFKENFGGLKLVATLATLAGMVLLRM